MKQIPKEESVAFYYLIAKRFSPNSYLTIKSFVQRYEAILEAEWEAITNEETEREDALEQQRRTTFKDDYEYCDLYGEVIVRERWIEVQAFGWREGFRESLPSGGEYQGKGSGVWHYPIAMKEVFCSSSNGLFQGMPVLYAGSNPYKGVKR